jgi:hypothetical protein
MTSIVSAERPEQTLAEPLRSLRICQETVRRDWYGDGDWIPKHSVEVVLEAAECVERAVQEELVGRGGAGVVIDMRSARSLWNAQWQAHIAIAAKPQRRARHKARHKDAKELRMRAADGQLFTVCVGYVFRRFDETTMRFNAPDMFDEENYPGRVPLVPLGDGDGCGLIIDDGKMGKPGPPKRYCDRCSAKAGRTMNAGLAKNALARLRRSRR